MLRKVAAAPEAPARPEAASSAVLWPKAAAPLRTSQQTCVMWSEQLEKSHEDPMCRWRQARVARLTHFSPFIPLFSI